jgi:hypothetical protein
MKKRDKKKQALLEKISLKRALYEKARKQKIKSKKAAQAFKKPVDEA